MSGAICIKYAVQNIVLLLVWRFTGGKNAIVNAVENGAQTFKEVKDIR